jgi:hypothetical protein
MSDTSTEQPIVLYSTKTWLAYIIAQQYYRSEHFVWCTPYFDASAVAEIDYAVPPSSSPCDIYRTLRDDVQRNDAHSAKINSDKLGIQRGAHKMAERGVIDEDQRSDIVSIVDGSVPQDHRPLILVIPFGLVQNVLTAVPVSQRAHRLSVEFIIERLPRTCFDVINPEGR